MNNQTPIKQQLIKHLNGGQAFSPIDKVVKEMPFDKIGLVPDGLPYSFYQLLYHIRVAQLDILEYCRDDDYQNPDWPDDYWPEETVPADPTEWQKLIDDYFEERQEFCDMIQDPESDLLEPFKSNSEHNLLRQAELIIEHTAYHTGQLYVLFRLASE